MAKTCNGCTEIQTPADVPYIVHESTVARQERHIKRLWIALIVAIAMIFASNAIWLYAWMQYDYESYSYDVSADGNSDANFIGEDCNIYNGGENSSEEESSEEEE